MVKHQCVDIGGIGNFGGLDGRRVIIQRVGQKFGQRIDFCRVQCIRDGLHQLRLQNFVDQNIGVLCRRRKPVAFFRVTADHQRAATIIKAIAIGWRDRRMRHGEGGNFQPVFFVNRNRAGFRRIDGTRAQSGIGGRQHGHAVMGDAVAIIKPVSHVEPVDHLVDARPAINVQLAWAPAHPACQMHLAQRG